MRARTPPPLPRAAPSPAGRRRPPATLQDSGLAKAYVFAAMMFVAPVVGTLCAGQSNRLSIGTQIMVRSELTASIYRKALRLRWGASAAMSFAATEGAGPCGRLGRLWGGVGWDAGTLEVTQELDVLRSVAIASTTQVAQRRCNRQQRTGSAVAAALKLLAELGWDACLVAPNRILPSPGVPTHSTRAKHQTETGRIVNLMSTDVNQLMTFFYPFAAQLVTGPAMLIASVVLLWFQIK